MNVSDVIKLLKLMDDYEKVLEFDLQGDKALIAKYEAESCYEEADEYQRKAREEGESLDDLRRIRKSLLELQLP